jgi:hypothetical protein
VHLRLELLSRDEGVQSRTGLDEKTVRHYAELMRDGSEFPALAVFDDGDKLWLADGFHRAAAATRAGLESHACEVRRGARRDAVLYSIGANSAHGLPRSWADKRRAVLVLLDDPEWSRWSNGEIARRAGVSDRFVCKMRALDRPEAVGTARLARRGRQVYEMKPRGRAPKQTAPNYIADWIYYLVRFTPRQFVLWQQIVKGRTQVAVLSEAVDVVMRGVA